MVAVDDGELVVAQILVLSFDADTVTRLENEFFDMGLLVPGTEVSAGIKVGHWLDVNFVALVDEIRFEMLFDFGLNDLTEGFEDHEKTR